MLSNQPCVKDIKTAAKEPVRNGIIEHMRSQICMEQIALIASQDRCIMIKPQTKKQKVMRSVTENIGAPTKQERQPF